MKKLFLSFFLCVMAVVASAQVTTSVDGKFELCDDAGVGAGVTFAFDEHFEFAPSISVFFPGSNTTLFSLEGDVHYKLPELTDKLDLYPIAGLGYYHWNTKYNTLVDNKPVEVKDKDNLLLVNLGFGARYHLSDQWAVFAEEKVQLVTRHYSNFLSIGISYTLDL